MSVRAQNDARPCTGRCFMSRTATDEKRDVFAEVHIVSTYMFLFKRPKNINTKKYVSLAQLGMNNLQRTRAIEYFAILCKCGFHLNRCQGGLNLSNFNNMFLWRNFDINIYIIACKDLFYPCKSAGYRTVAG